MKAKERSPTNTASVKPPLAKHNKPNKSKNIVNVEKEKTSDVLEKKLILPVVSKPSGRLPPLVNKEIEQKCKHCV